MQVDVAELSWENIKKYIYTPDGSLPDICVLATTRDDWSKWIDFINATYKVMFRDANEQEHEKIDFAAVVKCWDDNQVDGWPFASILVGEVQVNCFFRIEDEIDGDIDPRQFNHLDNHLQLMHYLTNMSKLLAKHVVMLCEGTRVSENNQFDPEPILTVDHATVLTNAYWLSTWL
ncbi:hypothetical protein [Hymenobacter glacieicola]|uniref:Uncharacterized protein n=1 Tax=Hymenobacter glacieicola TaxID=1562124 RepID=A0ABQ1WPR0_9BACT|nr:hypothetical protein [Hymenobacter glacieicola]GGG40688.1 hypothetical protein GCM10011378_16150 [Hymenobacter glacieicola]